VAGGEQQQRRDDDLFHTSRDDAFDRCGNRGFHKLKETRLHKNVRGGGGDLDDSGVEFRLANPIASPMSNDEVAQAGRGGAEGHGSDGQSSTGDIFAAAGGILPSRSDGKRLKAGKMPAGMETKSYAFLTMTEGPWIGAQFALDPSHETRIGRSPECQILLNDPRCSRVHAVIGLRERAWWIRDSESTNGTFVNGQKIDEAQLTPGSVLRVGPAAFEFHDRERPGNEAKRQSDRATQTIIRQFSLDSHDTSAVAVASLRDAPRAHDFLRLYELSLELLGVVDPDEVIRVALSSLRQRVPASLVGFLWIDDQGRLRPKAILPMNSPNPMKLSDALTEMVCRQGRAVWIDTRTSTRKGDALSHYADAFCVPLLHEQATVGAIHVYLSKGQFEQMEFDFAISIANILAIALVRSRREASLAADHRRLVAKTGSTDDLIGNSQPITQLRARIARVAAAHGPVLVRGESGVGKELVARALHRGSPRSDRPLLAVNCAALPRDLMESQLFGHKKGAFTGADSDHVGMFQQADSSTLFLDEIGELSTEGQAKLLRILEGHPFQPVGSTREVHVDVRVIAATNRDLVEFVRQGRFRQDLYYRLSVFELPIAPLRDRGEDLELLVDHFLEHFKRQYGRSSLKLGVAARQQLLSYRWPGNVRQLRNVIDSAVVLATGDEIQLADLGLREAGGESFDSLELAAWERRLIQEALARAGQSVPEAAKLLGISRATLYRKVEEYGIPRG
jgi:Nif-specific regulatory protein